MLYLSSLVPQNHPYPMILPELGHAVILNNLEIEIPETVQDVENLKSVLKTIGFKVTSYTDKNARVRGSVTRLVLFPFLFLFESL